MQFLSDNAAAVHPKVWNALRAADAADSPYDSDVFSGRLDEAFSTLFGRECVGLWVGTGTAANCLALATMVAPHGGVICHREAHIETDECGAPGFYLHGAKLLLAEGEGAKLTPASIQAVLDGITRGIHQAPAQAISLTQASEYGLVYRPGELAAISALAKQNGLGLQVDGARFANAVAFLGCTPADAAGPADTLSFGCTKNGGMGGDVVVLFDPEQAELVRRRRKRAGHLQSKGRFIAAQVLALIEDGLWLANARAANAAAQAIAAPVIAAGAGGRLVHPVEANEVFIRLTGDERDALRSQGFAFYDWDDTCCRMVASWDTRVEDAERLGEAISCL